MAKNMLAAQGCEGGKRKPQVSEKMDRQAVALDDLENVWINLKDRLRPICRESTPEVESDKKKVQEDLVPVAEALQSTNDRINQVVQHVRDVGDRLEL